MVPLNQLTRETILSKEILTEVFDQEDELYKAELLASLGLRAAELKVKTEFKDLVAAYKRVERDMKKQTEAMISAFWITGRIFQDRMTI